MTIFSRKNLVVLVAAGCCALVALLYLGQDPAAAAAKLVASTAFLALAIRVGALRTAYGRFVFFGLVFSWSGDVLLIGKTPAFFLAGLAAFLLAHAAYIAAFTVKGINTKWAMSAAIPVTLLALVVSAWLTPHLSPTLVVPVRIYTAVISLMVIAAFGTRGHGASILILAGALLFFMSDLSVAALRLVQAEFPTYVWGLPLYYAGQVCLAVSASQSRSH